MTPGRSDGQAAAADPSRSVWVAASAGAGKTTVLTARVLALLLRGAKPQRLLCVTYTRAAAAEMSNRIADRLSRWAVLPTPALKGEVEALLHRALDDDDPILRRARRLFALVLDEPGGLKIQTIHGFCQSLLGRFPLEAGLAPHFAVIEDRRGVEMLREAREAVIVAARAEPDGALAQALAVIADHAQEDSFAKLLSGLLAGRGRLHRQLDAHGGLHGLIDAIARRLGVARDATPADAGRTIIAGVDRVKAARAAAVLIDSGPKDQAKGLAIGRALDAGDPEVAFGHYAAALLTGEGEPFKDCMTKALGQRFPDVKDFLSDEAVRVAAALEMRRKATVLTATAALLTVGTAILDRYAAAKRAAAALDYDDLILATRRLLERQGGASWVLFKLDGGIDHILIDEAQDTNPEQWAVIGALANEFFSGVGARIEGDYPRTLFVVGDAKQSIYSFQGADPEAFARMRATFAARIEAVGDRLDAVDLDVSYRSTEPVLTAVDAVFNTAAGADGVIEPGQPSRHMPVRHGVAGSVEVWPEAAPLDVKDDEADWSPPVSAPRPPEPKIQVAEAIAGQIQAWLATGEALESRGRPIRAGDVLVLVRRRNTFVDALIRACKRRGVPVAGLDRMKLTQHIGVMDLLALARFLLLPEDDLSLAAALKSPLYGFDDDALYALAQGRTGTLWRALGQNAAAGVGAGAPFAPEYARAHAHLSDLLRVVNSTPPYELFARLLGPDRGREAMAARLGGEALDPLDEFLSQALAFERDHAPSLQGFVAWLDAGEVEIKRDADTGERDEVRIMTVHGAKGLEAPIVFLPDTMQVPVLNERLIWPKSSGDQTQSLRKPLAGPLWAPHAGDADAVWSGDREDARIAAHREYRRLLYVGITRAADRLYVAGWRGTKKAPDGHWRQLIEAALKPHAVERAVAQPTTDHPFWFDTALRVETPQVLSPTAKPGPAETARHTLVGLPEWARRPAPAEPDPGRPLAPSRPNANPALRSPLGAASGRTSGAPGLDGVEAGFERGRLIHRLLQSLPDIPPDAEAPGRRVAVAQRFLAAAAPSFDAAGRAALIAETLAVLDAPAFADVFAPGSRAEVPVVGRVGAHVVSGRIDRLAVGPDRVTIVDFKTNRPPPATVAGVAPAHLLQLALYRVLVQRVYPGRAVAAALLWTDAPRLMAIPSDLLDAHAAPDA